MLVGYSKNCDQASDQGKNQGTEEVNETTPQTKIQTLNPMKKCDYLVVLGLKLKKLEFKNKL